jgi:hypothetical protein
MLEIASHHRHLTVRPSSDADRPALDDLAALDSAEPLTDGRALVAELDGRPVAALMLGDQKVIADPFERTAEIVEILRRRVREVTQRRPRRGLALLPLPAR